MNTKTSSSNLCSLGIFLELSLQPHYSVKVIHYGEKMKENLSLLITIKTIMEVICSCLLLIS